MGPKSYSNPFDHLLSLPSLPVSVPSEQPSLNPGLTLGGYNDNSGNGYPLLSHNMNRDAPIQFDGTSFTLHNELINTIQQAQLPRNENMQALGQLQSTTPPFISGGPSNLTSSYMGFEDFFPEEEIRMRSHEMLKNEDMQHLLRIFNMGDHGHGSANVTEDGGYPYSANCVPNQSPNYSYDEDRTRSSGKAVVGWLKLKAALRWGIFIRKQAAERRAQIVDLDES